MDVKESKEDRKPRPSHTFDKGGEAVDKITDHTKGLFEDLTAWAELKIQYTLLDYQDQVTTKAKSLIFEGVSFAILGIAALFGLVALALGLGSWLSHPAWGFLVVTGLLVAVALVVRFVGKRIARGKRPERIMHDVHLKESQPKLPGRTITESTLENQDKDELS